MLQRMGRRYRRKKPDILDIIPPVFGLIFLCVFFVPGFKQTLGSVFFPVLSFLGLVMIGLIIRAIWRRSVKKDEVTALPTFVHSDEERALFRAAMGVSQPTPSIKVVAPYVETVTWSRELLSKLEWKRFEEVVAAYSRELGYEAKTTRIGADGGVDVQLFQNGQPNPVMIIQCKAWDAYKVGVKPVRELYGVMAADKVANGAFFTTGEFTTEAHEWARDKSLDLVDGREFMSRLGQLSPAIQQKLWETATAGDYTTPTCPSCDIKMVQRTAGKGSNIGGTFWGCRNYPRCQQTFKMVQSD